MRGAARLCTGLLNYLCGDFERWLGQYFSQHTQWPPSEDAEVLECAAGFVVGEEAVCAGEDGEEREAAERMRLRLPDSKSLPVMRE
jgi:hypothetical protein